MSIMVNNSGHFGRSHTTSLRQVQIGQQCFLDVGARGHRSGSKSPEQVAGCESVT